MAGWLPPFWFRGLMGKSAKYPDHESVSLPLGRVLLYGRGGMKDLGKMGGEC